MPSAGEFVSTVCSAEIKSERVSEEQTHFVNELDHIQCFLELTSRRTARKFINLYLAEHNKKY